MTLTLCKIDTYLIKDAYAIINENENKRSYISANLDTMLELVKGQIKYGITSVKLGHTDHIILKKLLTIDIDIKEFDSTKDIYYHITNIIKEQLPEEFI